MVELVTLPKVARLYGVDRQTPYEWSHRPGFPPSNGKSGRLRIYPLRHVQMWHRWHFHPIREFVLHLRVMPFGYEGTPCIFWTGTCDSNGYGQHRAGDKAPGTGAHRFAYNRWWGPIPDGLELDHLCRRPSCCNPRHLEPVTHAENVMRGMSPAARLARLGTCGAGHERNAENTRTRTDGTKDCRVCERIASRKRRKARGQRPRRPRKYP